MNEKPYSGSLASLSPQQECPRNAKPEDFKVAEVASGFGQNGKAGSAEGMGKLVSRSENQDHPRFSQDSGAGKSGAGTPSTWMVQGFAPSQNHGEEGTSVSNPNFVNCKDGQHNNSQK